MIREFSILLELRIHELKRRSNFGVSLRELEKTFKKENIIRHCESIINGTCVLHSLDLVIENSKYTSRLELEIYDDVYEGIAYRVKDISYILNKMWRKKYRVDRFDIERINKGE